MLLLVPLEDDDWFSTCVIFRSVGSACAPASTLKYRERNHSRKYHTDKPNTQKSQTSHRLAKTLSDVQSLYTQRKMAPLFNRTLTLHHRQSQRDNPLSHTYIHIHIHIQKYIPLSQGRAQRQPQHPTRIAMKKCLDLTPPHTPHQISVR